MDPVSALITGGLGLVGGLFGSKKSKQPEKTVVENHVDYQRMVTEAEAAGFNPLTALRNGGAAGYSVSTQSHPGLSNSNEMIGEAFNTVGRVFQAYQDGKVEDEQNKLQEKLVNAQLANIQADTALKMRSFDVPTATGRPYKSGGAEMSLTPTASPATMAAFDYAVNGAGREFADGNNTVTNPVSLDNDFWKVNPRRPDAQAVENRYGDNELVSSGSSILGLYDDLNYSLNKWQGGSKEGREFEKRFIAPMWPWKYERFKRDNQIVPFTGGGF